ncbi:MAG: glycine zipper 2TM domain-containing protein [Aquabacterium sp.]|uniref:glycine zipper 2TM domain-containing protein n=1 Tax=Aquabacterium sp. TaxID=1872578 RepID=UPI002719F5B2|nr:glycine zipper 2TM domain-containing protein [Aquabacterium sp.]MDO9002738.1 glycine zipper 2TM domain-containing protein [Aquabacterium sp.]
MKRFVIAASTGLMLAVLAACSTTSPDVVKPGDAQRLSQVEDAVVLNVRPVVVEGSQSGAGAATGAVIGGVGGSAVGGSREQVIVGVIGAVVGGVVGNAAERYGTREDANEILLQMSNGQRRSIIQAKGNETFNPGDAVLLVTTGGKVRVMRAPPVQRPAR